MTRQEDYTTGFYFVKNKLSHTDILIGWSNIMSKIFQVYSKKDYKVVVGRMEKN